MADTNYNIQLLDGKKLTLSSDVIERYPTIKEQITDMAGEIIFLTYEDCIIYQEKDRLDINFDKNIDFESAWFKHNSKGVVSTSSLTAEEITRWRNDTWAELIKELKPRRLL